MKTLGISSQTAIRCAQSSKDAYDSYTIKGSRTDTEALIKYYCDQTVVAVRGTSSYKDVKQDMKRMQKDTKHGDMHLGFRQCAMEVFSRVMSKLAKTKAPVVFTGHSLGGAVAQILSTMYPGECSCVTFGSPRVGDKDFCNYLIKCTDSKLLLVEHELDRVPWVPFFGYAKPKSYIKKVWNWRVWITSAHSIDNYIRLTEKLVLG